jgi:hypothetical protein
MCETNPPVRFRKSARDPADIVFVLDATGSMSPCIGAVKDNIFAFIEALCAKNENGESLVKDWRAKVVGYRDVDADKDRGWFIDNPFVTATEALRDQLSKIEACGGGDGPGPLLDALRDVINMGETDVSAQETSPSKWRHRRVAHRFVIVFTDASYHPRTADGAADHEDIIKLIHANRIRLCVYAPDMMCYHELSVADKSEYLLIPCAGDSTAARAEALAEFTKNKDNFWKNIEVIFSPVAMPASF